MKKTTFTNIFLSTVAALATSCGLAKEYGPTTQKSEPIAHALNGDHQFTVLADTNHRDPALMEYFSQSVDPMAKAGVKHIMMEFFQPSGDISESFPNVTGDVREKREKMMDKAYDLSLEITDQAMLMHDDNPDISFEHARTEIENKPENKERHIKITTAQILLEVAILLEEIYHNPTEKNFEKLRICSDLLVNSGNAFRKEDRSRINRAVVELIINAAKHGIRVHFTNDHAGFDLSEQGYEIKRQIDQIMEEDPELEHHFLKGAIEGSEYIKNLNISDKERIDLARKMAQLVELHKRMPKTDDRVSPESEKARADLFIELANGERAVIIWGAGHFDKVFDIDEYLDRALHEQRSEFEPTKVVEIWESKARWKLFTDFEKPEDQPDITHWMTENETELKLH